MSMKARHRAPSPRRRRTSAVTLGALAAVVVLAVLAVSVTGFSSATFTARTLNPVGTVTAASDWTPPTVAVTPPAGGNVSGVAQVSATASDAESGVAQVVVQAQPADASSWTTLCTDTSAPYSCSWDTRTGTPDGPYELRAVATDKAGYSTTSEVVRTYVANSFAIVLGPLGEAVTGTVQASMTVYNAGLTASAPRVEYSPAGSGRWSTACTGLLVVNTSTTCQWGTTAVADGLYDVRATVTAGFTTYTSAVQTDVLVDNTRPAVTMTDPGTPLSGTRTFSATATDAGAGVDNVQLQYQRGTGAWQTLCTADAAPWSCRFDTTTLAGGTYAFRAVATDGVGLQTTSATVANRVVDNSVSSVSLADPGTYLSGTVTLSAAANAPSGVTSVRVQRAPAGGSTWTDVCTVATAPYSCTVDTSTITDGTYDLRAVLLDGKGVVTTSAVVAGRIVDNSPVRGLDVQGTRGAGTVGRVDNGDRVTFTYSETVATSSLVSGWNGSTRTVTVRLRDGASVGGSSKEDVLDLPGVNLGSVTLRGDYVRSGRTVQWTGSMTATTTSVSGVNRTVVTVTLGAVTSGSGLRTVSTSPTMVWNPSASATDATGRKCSTAPATESGAADRDF
jgi:hypothetical protein